MTEPQLEALAESYGQGVTIPDLAKRFGINETTVQIHVRRMGLPARRPALSGEQIDQAADLYAAGRSLKLVAAQFGVNASTIHRALRANGVAIRKRGRRRQT